MTCSANTKIVLFCQHFLNGSIIHKTGAQVIVFQPNANRNSQYTVCCVHV